MRAIEFQTFLGTDKIIKIPEELSKTITDEKVRVIVLAEEKHLSREEFYDREKDRAEDFINWLMKNPVKVDKSIPFLTRDEIYDRDQ